MNASQIRQKFIDFQTQLGHAAIPPAPLVLDNDPTTLFTGSGMQPLLPYLLGATHPQGNKLTNSQPCLRLQDIEDVGDPRHTTVFEMLGNWSLGAYFKEEQIRNYFKFLTEEIGLDPEKIFVTCFIGSEKYGIPKDLESAQIWQTVFAEVGITAEIAEIGTAKHGDERGIKPGERIFFYDDHENWWSRGGGIETTPIGDPCGPDSEVFFDFGEDKQDIAKFGKSHPASDGARFMEIGNQVFMQYKRNTDGTFSELDHKNVDFGGGLERLAAASIGSFDVFKTSLMLPIITKLEELSGKKYDNNTDEMRIIADHLRGAYLLTAQGLTPSNKAQGYALRRLIRRAILKALDLGIAQNFLQATLQPIITEYQSLPDHILPARDQALSLLEKEEKAFRTTLNKGLKALENFAKQAQKTHSKLTGADLFKLQDTYGFPLELSVEKIFRDHIPLSDTYKTEFDQALAIQRQRSQTASKGMFKGGLSDTSDQTVKYHTSAHLLLAALNQILTIPSPAPSKESDSTPNLNYSTHSEKSQDISSTNSKNPSHFASNPQNSFKIEQKGSNITPERLRFDFNFDRKLTSEEINQIESLVNHWIEADLPVTSAIHDKNYAFDILNAHGSFRDRYPDQVTVYTIGTPENHVSHELCGGPHVTHTGIIGKFKILKEESSSAGVRRIKAVLE